jgi:uncharacterized iron-regulated membrane protein
MSDRGNETAQRPGLTKRQAFYRVHLWLGIAIGTYFAMLGISGSLLVFGRELDGYLNADILKVTPASDRLPVSAIMESVRKAHPSVYVDTLKYPTTPDGVYSAKSGPASASQLHVYIDPYTGRITGERTLASSFYGFLVYLHINLFLGPMGRTLNGWGALLLIVLLVSGFVLWWPGTRATRAVWKARLTIRRDAGAPRFLFDLHNTVGVYPFVFSVLSMLTALEFAFPDQVRPFLHAVGGSSRSPVALRSAGSDEDRPRVPGAAKLPKSSVMVGLDVVVASADRVAEGRIHAIDFPKTSDEPILVTKALDAYNRTRARIEIAVDPHDARVLAIHDTRVEPTGSALVRWCVPLHYGIWGGLSTRVLYVILGVGPTAAFVTGLWKWRLRVARQRQLAVRLESLGMPASSGV